MSASAAAPLSLEFYNRMLGCSRYEDIHSRVLRPIAEAIHANSAVFLQFQASPCGRSLVERYSYMGPSPDSANVYASEGLQSQDPVVQPYLKLLQDGKRREIIYLDTLSEKRGWRQTRYYREFLEPFDFGHITVINFPIWSPVEPEMLCMGFHRPRAARPFSTAELNFLRELKPMLHAVFGNVTYREKLDLSGLLMQAMDKAGGHVGCVVLDQDLAIRHVNAQGRFDWGLIAHGVEAGTIQRLNLPSGIADELKALVKHPGERKRIKIASSENRAAFEIEACAFFVSSGVRFMLISVDCGVEKRITAACREAMLTLRESELVTLLAHGATNADISEELHISSRTVENHLRAIYVKMGVNSRTQVISRVLGLQ